MYNEKFPDTGQKYGAIQKKFVLYDKKCYYLHVQKKIPNTCQKDPDSHPKFLAIQKFCCVTP